MFSANAWGLFDMHGNVWEWVQDVVHDNYDGAPLDGSAWEEGGDQARRILRGGSWLYNPRYLRSALLNVPITKKNWLGYRFATEPHCDLAEQLTFYSVGGRDGAARRFNLDFYCKAFGIESPKSAGVTGMDVKDLMAAGKFRDIAEYCLRDVRATVELYKIWKERLAGIK